MNNEIYDDFAIEQIAKDKFGLKVDIKQVIARSVAVSHTPEARVFLTDKNQLFVLISGEARLPLRDIRTIVTRMGLKAELYLPPKGEPDYFDRIGREKFKEVFPGKHAQNPEDIAFYRTLVPYNPALVQISEVRDGVIRQFDNDSQTKWRVAAEFAYRRIRTS